MTTFLITLAWLAGAVLLVFLAFVAFVMTALRTENPRMLRAVRRMNRAGMNRLQVRTAGAPGNATGLLRHRGRTSGREYATPIGPFPVEDGFEVALPYGPDVDWLRNLRAAGSAVLEFDGARYRVENPEVVRMANSTVADNDRMARMFGVRNALRVRATKLVG